jgi:hypothetical protein
MEASFLQSRQSRSRPSRKISQDRRNAFWESARTFLVGWYKRLDALAMPVSETDKRNVQMSLRQLMEEFEMLRNVCLTSNNCDSASSSSTTLEDVVPVDAASLIMPPPDDLPYGDLRMLHEELQKNREKFDAVKQRLLPKGKFVFKRYRQAMAQRLLEQASGAAVVEVQQSPRLVEPVPPPYSKAAAAADTKYSITDIQGLSLTVLSDGSIKGADLQPLATDGPILLRNICNSTVDLYVIFNCFHPLSIRDGSRFYFTKHRKTHFTIVIVSCRRGVYSAVHILNVVNSTVRVLHFIAGAVHVTTCHDCTFVISKCQQLRLHESTLLVCRATVSAGAILEKCRNITFQTTTPNEKLEINDFDWLKRGAPSPNFCIQNVGPTINADLATSIQKNEEYCEPLYTVAAAINTQPSTLVESKNDSDDEEL